MLIIGISVLVVSSDGAFGAKYVSVIRGNSSSVVSMARNHLGILLAGVHIVAYVLKLSRPALIYDRRQAILAKQLASLRDSVGVCTPTEFGDQKLLPNSSTTYRSGRLLRRFC
jgi:hypothetical protein